MRTHERNICALLTSLIATSLVAGGDIYVDVNTGEDGEDRGGTWPTALKTLQSALDKAFENEGPDTIWVADGTYVPGDERDDTFTLVDQTWILGGFKGPEGEEQGEGDISERDPAANEIILSGDLDQDDDPEDPGTWTDNSLIVVTSPQNDIDTFIDGFTIRGGNLDDEGPSDTYGGAGMRVYVGEPSIVRCLFTENHASDLGQADRVGGALWIGAASGGGPSNDPKVINCEFFANTVDGNGGALGTSGVVPLVYDCLFFDNEALEKGGAAGGWGAHFFNCTIAENSAQTTGGVIGSGAQGGLHNCIVWANTDAGGAREEKQIDFYGPSTVTYTSVMNCSTDNDPPGYGLCSAQGGDGNNGDDPQFIGSGSFRLQSSSPARDSGSVEEFLTDEELRDIFKDALDINANGYHEELTPDLDLGKRVLGPKIDRGPYETGGACPTDTNSDGFVDFDDLLQVLTDWGPCQICAADFNDDGSVDFDDLLAVLSTWGPCPGVQGPDPATREEVWASMGLDSDDWDLFMAKMSSGTTADRDNHRCWVDHYYYAHFLQTCFCSPDCPDDDPYSSEHMPPP